MYVQGNHRTVDELYWVRMYEDQNNNNSRNFRKLKWSSNFNKIHAVLKKCNKNSKQTVLIYIQSSFVQTNLSRVGCILPASIYMSTIQLLGKTLNQYHAKCMRFSKM